MSLPRGVSRRKQLITVFFVANAQKQGAETPECIEGVYATMFQEEKASEDETEGVSAAFDFAHCFNRVRSL